MHKKRRQEEIFTKKSKRRLRCTDSSPRGFTREDAIQIRKERIQKEEAQDQARAHRPFMRLWRIERDSVQAQGVLARKNEKYRAKIVRECLLAKREVPLHLSIPIIDLSIEWKATNETWKQQEALKTHKKERNGYLEAKDEQDEEEEVTFVTDTTGDVSLQADFLPFPAIDDEDDDELDTSDSESDT